MRYIGRQGEFTDHANKKLKAADFLGGAEIYIAIERSVGPE